MRPLFFFITMILSISSWAIRDVRGGGGLAEMQTVYLHQNLNQYIRICMDSQNPCQLAKPQLQEYAALFQRHEADARQLSLEFMGHNPTGQTYILKGDKIQIPSSALYNSESEPYELKKLLAFMIAVRLDILKSADSIKNNYARALTLFSHLQQVHQFHRVVGLPKLVMMHTYDIRFVDLAEKKFFIEDFEATHDLSDKVAEKLPCGSLASWKTQNWKSSVGTQDIYFVADATNSCLSPGRSAKLVIQVKLDSDLRVLVPSTQVSFRY